MAASSWNPELSKKIGVAGLLAPVLSLRRVDTPMYNLLVKIPVETWLAKAGIYSVGQVGLALPVSDVPCRLRSAEDERPTFARTKQPGHASLVYQFSPHRRHC